ncbi:MAG: hypothetical protein CVV64_03695 [Candidatus Wallbacteria bacterium HGW-Wallbacteria-1]|jgi:prepilin-type N-terminal cleavage/methylation domain-containing protein|uniref:Type II secretion system protein J n=1 Tax=Candidatus Wallbacteria bacterium HGW-Wallbacteria-1 TaxID=2013854 RepID=A0A2N1PTV1_9BACT|nr:MAG: hypothetical protein CVV64_03695 [Candidatus Wallbacteria bacterium HGW-Wallbacteria-1]
MQRIINFRRSDRRRGFTLAELTVASAVLGIMSIALFNVMSNHLGAWNRGNTSMRLRHEVQKVVKSLYNDFRSINPSFYMDESYNIWFQGEDRRNMKLNTLKLIDGDSDLTNGCERLQYQYQLVEPFGQKRRIEYYMGSLDPADDTLYLIREMDGKPAILSKCVPRISFERYPYDKRQVLVEATVRVTDNKGANPKEETINLVLRIDHSYMIVE